MRMTRALTLAAATLMVLAGCVAPHPSGQDRQEMVTGSNIPKKHRPGDDNVQVYKPTPGDIATYGAGLPSPGEPARP
jgi:hypothetical protein